MDVNKEGTDTTNISEKLGVTKRHLHRQAVKTIQDPISATEPVKVKLSGPAKDKMVRKLEDFLAYLYSKYEDADIIEGYKSKIQLIVKEEIESITKMLDEAAPNFNRAQMPQVKTDDLGKAIDMVSDKVRVTRGKISAGKLKKSQKELDTDKVKGIANRFSSPNTLKPLIISKDYHIVDGHHRWGAAIYKWGDDVKIPIIMIHLPIMKAIKLFKDVANSLDEVMSVGARKKLARKSKSKLKRGLKKRIKKMKMKRSNSDLLKAAERKAKTILMKKMMKKAPADMSMNDKMKFSEKLAKSPGKIQKVARKILPKLKQAETERVKNMRAQNTKKANEDITIPINVGDTILGGKFKNKRIVVKSIDKNEKGDITINGKPLLKYRLVSENTDTSIQCSNCKHSWEIETNDDRPYLCHSCGYDSQIQKIDLVGLENWKSSINEANAVSGGKIHKFITGKNLTFKGKKYSELYFEVLRIDNNSKLVTLKILSPKPLFGNEINVPFRTINRGPFLKTDTSGISEIDSDEETEGLPVIRRDGASNLNNSGQYSKVVEVAKRDYKKEYEKYGKSEKAKKYRAELNKYNRDKGTYGNGDGKDASHKNGKIVGFEEESKNRGRAEKSRLKKESSINEFGGVRFDLVGFDSNDKPVLKTIKRSSDSFMKDVAKYGSEKLFKGGKGVEYVKIYHDKNHLMTVKDGGRGVVKEKGWSKLPINEIPMGDLKQIDTFADKQLNPMDVVLTGKHFFDRLNDPRNGKEISSAELIGFFKRLSKKKSEFVDFLNKYNSLVATDSRTNLNIPFMKQANKAIAKTVMRKKDFKTPDKKLDI